MRTLGPAVVLFAASLALLGIAFQTLSLHPWSMLDLHVYLWGGRLARHSEDPYLFSYAHSLRFTYTPEAADVFALMSLLNAAAVKALMSAVSIASLLGALWLTSGAVHQGPARDRLGLTLAIGALAIWLEPVRQTLSLGQVNLLLMAVVLADLRQPDGRWWKGAGVGLAAGFKLTPLIFIPYLLLTRRFRAAAVATATFGLTIAASATPAPAAAEHYWFDGLFLNADRAGNLAYIGNQSLYGALLRLLGSPATARPYQAVALATVGAGGLLVAAWAARRGQEMAGILLCALTGLLVSPVSWSHHWVWVAPTLVALAAWATAPPPGEVSRSRRLGCWLSFAAVCAVFSGVLWTVPAAALQGHLMTAPEQVLGDLYVLAGLGGLAAVIGLLARAQRRERRVVIAEPSVRLGSS